MLHAPCLRAKQLLLLLSALALWPAYAQAEAPAEVEPTQPARTGGAFAPENAQTRTYITESTPTAPVKQAVQALVIPIEGGISKAQLFILRRGLKEATRIGSNVVVLDIDTPGGELGTTLEIMEALERFEGDTIAFVNDEAISAGSYISIVTDAIYMAPTGLIGAAEAVQSGGEDINESMKRKLESYLDARVRSLARQHRYRADVQRAMMKPDYELSIDGTVLSPEGDLLTLTAEEATQLYGDPLVPLLASGIAEDVQSVLENRYGNHPHHIRTLELSIAEHIAKLLTAVAPVLLGLGGLLLFIEFKTPGFGIFGMSGLVLIAVVFASNYIAGLAGQEPFVLFGLGVVLVFVELLVFPGVLVVGALGALLMLGSLLWSMLDIWPQDSFDDFALWGVGDALTQLLYAGLVCLIGIVLTLKILPKSSFWDKLVLSTSVGSSSRSDKNDARVATSYQGSEHLPPVGSHGVSMQRMAPVGEVEIDGKRYLARAQTDLIHKDTAVEVCAQDAFRLIVRPVDEA